MFKYLLFLLLAFTPMNDSNNKATAERADVNVGEVVLKIQGEGWHKVELLNPQKFDTLYLHINVNCDDVNNPYKLRRVSHN